MSYESMRAALLLCALCAIFTNITRSAVFHTTTLSTESCLLYRTPQPYSSSLWLHLLLAFCRIIHPRASLLEFLAVVVVLVPRPKKINRELPAIAVKPSAYTAATTVQQYASRLGVVVAAGDGGDGARIRTKSSASTRRRFVGSENFPWRGAVGDARQRQS